MKRRIRGPLALALCAIALPAAAGTRIDLNGRWQFRIDPDGAGAARGLAAP